MKIFFRLFARYIFFWLLFFVATKILFLSFHFPFAKELSFIDFLQIFLNGFKLDFSTIAYILILPILIFLIFSAFKPSFFLKFLKIYTFFCLAITSFLVSTDMELYRHWGFRLDSTPIRYLAHPNEVIASFEILPTFIAVFLGAILFLIFKNLYNFLIFKRFLTLPKSNFKQIFVFILFGVSLIIPIRGGFGVAALKVGAVYFHKTNLFANHSAVNVLWNFIYSLSEYQKVENFHFFEREKAEKLFKKLFSQKNSSLNLLKVTKPNILLIIIESFTAKATEFRYKNLDITPRFNFLCKEGIKFTNFYASGDRTDKGIAAILSSFPALPTTSILNFQNKMEKIPNLNRSLKKLGYKSAFFYGGDLNFVGFRGYFTFSQFDKIIGMNDFSKNLQNTKWGVADEYVFEKFFETKHDSSIPFFDVILTSTSHEPFEVPMKTVIEGNDSEHKFLNSIFYVDSCLGNFIEKVKKTSFWENTLIIITADHGSSFPYKNQNFESEKFRIPMLWLGGAISKKDTIISQFATQTDIAPTLLNLLGLRNSEFSYGKNILSCDKNDFAYYIFNCGFGYLRENQVLIYDATANSFLLEKNVKDSLEYEVGKSYFQILTNSFNEL